MKKSLATTKEPKYVTMPVFEKSMDFIAKSFKKVFDKFDQNDKKFEQVFEKFSQHDKAFEVIIKEMKGFSQEAREHRKAMLDLNYTDVTQSNKIDGLEMRVTKLEDKIK